MDLWQNSAPKRSASLPSRGAWIEILVFALLFGALFVAPLTGSVDRNTSCLPEPQKGEASLPSRGAWIEMGQHGRDW